MTEWFEKLGEASDVCISTRARLARNISGFPFEGHIGEKERREIIRKTDDAIRAADSDNISKYEFIEFDDISENTAISFYEKHYISSDFLRMPSPKQLILNESRSIAIMVNEEDHLRIQSIFPGFCPQKAYEAVNEADDMLSSKLDFSFDDKLGYLTKCPTNLGTGLRISVMLHLPALTASKQISGVIKGAAKIGFTVRGFFGEGSEANGDLYQVSNQLSMGVTEKETAEMLEALVKNIIESERKIRTHMYKTSINEISDSVSRSEGVLRYAKLLSSEETVKIFSDLRLGISLGIIKGIDYKLLNRILFETMPAGICIHSGKSLGAAERDKARADYVASLLRDE